MLSYFWTIQPRKAPRSRAKPKLQSRGLKLAKVAGFKKALVAVARKLVVILHAMWKANALFRALC
jgi:hypothetical protein